MGDQTRNLRPHKPARLAMCLYNRKYAEYHGGSMDFWDFLSKGQKDTCREILKSIDKAPTEAESNARFA